MGQAGYDRAVPLEPTSLIETEIGGRYRIEGRLATGGMGAIYHGEHIELGRKVAVKVLSEQCALNEQAVKRFHSEARASSVIDHPNVVDILDLGRLESGEPYLVMELLEGEDLADVIAREAPMSLTRVVELLDPIAHALDAVHREGVLHRDIKPANIFVTTAPDGSQHPKLLDFGLATLRESPSDDELTREGIVVGTPHYLSPEAAEGEAVDERADVYSLGVVAFEMLTGLRPIEGDEAASLLYAKVRAPAPTLSERSGARFGDALEQVVGRTLSRRPGNRPSSSCALIEELRAAGAPGSIAPRPRLESERPAPPADNRPSVVTAAPAEPRPAPSPPQGLRRAVVLAGVVALLILLLAMGGWRLMS